MTDDELEMQIAEDEAKASEVVRRAVCVVCRVMWVDVLNGEDTCNECLRR